MKSETMRTFNAKSARLKTRSSYKTPDVDPDSNLAKVFKEEAKDRILMGWAETGLVGYARIEDYASKQGKFVINQSKFRDQQTDAILTLQILIPFPRYRLQADMNFIEAFSALQPPALKSTYQEEVRLGGRTGVYYKEESGACLVVVKLPQSGILSARSEKCESVNRLKGFVHMLDLDRLERKLNS